MSSSNSTSRLNNHDYILGLPGSSYERLSQLGISDIRETTSYENRDHPIYNSRLGSAIFAFYGVNMASIVLSIVVIFIVITMIFVKRQIALMPSFRLSAWIALTDIVLSSIKITQLYHIHMLELSEAWLKFLEWMLYSSGLAFMFLTDCIVLQLQLSVLHNKAHWAAKLHPFYELFSIVFALLLAHPFMYFATAVWHPNSQLISSLAPQEVLTGFIWGCVLVWMILSILYCIITCTALVIKLSLISKWTKPKPLQSEFTPQQQHPKDYVVVHDVIAPAQQTSRSDYLSPSTSNTNNNIGICSSPIIIASEDLGGQPGLLRPLAASPMLQLSPQISHRSDSLLMRTSLSTTDRKGSYNCNYAFKPTTLNTDSNGLDLDYGYYNNNANSFDLEKDEADDPPSYYLTPTPNTSAAAEATYQSYNKHSTIKRSRRKRNNPILLLDLNTHVHEEPSDIPVSLDPSSPTSPTTTTNYNRLITKMAPLPTSKPSKSHFKSTVITTTTSAAAATTLSSPTSPNSTSSTKSYSDTSKRDRRQLKFTILRVMLYPLVPIITRTMSLVIDGLGITHYPALANSMLPASQGILNFVAFMFNPGLDEFWAWLRKQFRKPFASTKNKKKKKRGGACADEKKESRPLQYYYNLNGKEIYL
ncbi:hypothetical protein H4219_002145 [Mycoemilia scoparia]|uniref:Uncharacterized protein n=1 Tax=Mycoemilia scoparia TaxID=417184 RepID=A0A9W8A1Y1_9FUNG|nr:hypothetical protein H4219_002145 [Mycoemilia scoparia]